MKKDYSNLTAIGWREWISFPDWGIENLKVKVDTGARTSSLHVTELEYFDKDGENWVSFYIHPWQKTAQHKIRVSNQINSFKYVTSSSGCKEKRPVILTQVTIADQTIKTEITLTNRSSMGFRMLLGRATIKKNFLVIPGKSYLGGKPPAEIRQKNRGKTL